MRRGADKLEKGRGAGEFNRPKSGEVRLPAGVPRFTILKIFSAIMLNSRLKRHSEGEPHCVEAMPVRLP